MNIKDKFGENLSDMDFNHGIPFTMHLDINSCFATIEQQANPFLRGKPLVVAAYDSPGGCVLAPSIEAKKIGIKVGMRVKDAKEIFPKVVVLPSDPWKYRNVHLSLRRILSDYTDKLVPKSIDEFVLNLEGYPCLIKRDIKDIAKEIKLRIRNEIGEWMSVSVGISTNRFLAKLASSLHKPDGLDEINENNYLDIYSNLKLTDLNGIKVRNSIRLNRVGIFSVLDFYNAPLWKLRSSFKSVNSLYWYLRLRGWEIDDFETKRRSYGNSYALPKPFKTVKELTPILMKLVEKMSFRLRMANYKANGIHLAIYYKDQTFWHKGIKTNKELFSTQDIYKEMLRLLNLSYLGKPVREIFVSCFNLVVSSVSQLELFNDVPKKEKLIKSIDQINNRWGEFVIFSAKMSNTENYIPDRIAFGGVKELEEFTLR
jgi:DNA polymerase-4